TLARGSLAGGQPREVLQDVRMADWSPDGSEMALVRMVNGKLRLEYPAGNVLAEFPYGLYSIRVSPDGQRVAFAQAENGRIAIHTVDRAGKNERVAFVSGQNPALDNPILCWVGDGHEIWF